MPEHPVFIAIGVMGILAGSTIAGKVINKPNAETMRKLIYISGVINLIG